MNCLEIYRHRKARAVTNGDNSAADVSQTGQI